MQFPSGDALQFVVSFGSIQEAASLPTEASCAGHAERDRAVPVTFAVTLRSSLAVDSVTVFVEHGNALGTALTAPRAKFVYSSRGSCSPTDNFVFGRMAPGDTRRLNGFFVITNAVSPNSPGGDPTLFSNSVMSVQGSINGVGLVRNPIWTGPNSATDARGGTQCTHLSLSPGGKYKC